LDHRAAVIREIAELADRTAIVARASGCDGGDAFSADALIAGGTVVIRDAGAAREASPRRTPTDRDRDRNRERKGPSP
jgi:hypothetical protein